jgi:PEGA domain
MRARTMRLAFEVSLCWGMVGPHAALLQSPNFGGGRLVINSDPQGAHILINDRQMQQTTDFTYVVGPGTYKVAVTGGSGNLNCAQKSVQVTSGNTATVTCTAKGWQ